MKKITKKASSLCLALLRLVPQPSGATTVLFALTFPSMLLFYSLGIDSARLLASQARLIDGLNQGMFAVAMTDNHHDNSHRQNINNTLVKEYLHYYLPDARISFDDITIRVTLNHADDSQNAGNRLDYVDYHGQAEVEVAPLFTFPSSGFGDKIRMQTDTSAGAIRVTTKISKQPTDYAFVLDFSGSMRGPSAEPGMNRINLLKKVIREFAQTVLEDNPNSKIALVPFSYGVPVKMGRNPAGGERIGCSFVAKWQPRYENVDLNFWYNKAFNVMNANQGNMMMQSYMLDKKVEEYYRSVVSPATRLTLDQMSSQQAWCVHNRTFGPRFGKAEYSCSFDVRAKMSSPHRYRQFVNQRDNALALMQETQRQTFAIANPQTLDYGAMLEDDFLFGDSSVITLPLPYARGANYLPFPDMCEGAQLADLDHKPHPIPLDQVFPSYYLIELTSDRNVLQQFDRMIPDGKTDSNSGLLRAVPVLLKGQNPRRVIILISDGEDNGDATQGPLAVTNTLHRQYKICDKIRRGLLHYTIGRVNVTESNIYYISVVSDAAAVERTAFWERECVGANKAFVATDYQNLIVTLMGIARNKRLDFINKSSE